MDSVKIIAVSIFLAMAIALGGCMPTLEDEGDTKIVNTTEWQIEPSFKYDVLCFLNALTGDEYYLDFYREEYEKFEPQFTPEVRLALTSLKIKLKDEQQRIISAVLSLIFSTSDAENLDEMLSELAASESMRERLSETTYYSDKLWQEFLSVNEELDTIFKFLIDIDFEGYWDQNIKPQVLEGIDDIADKVLSFDVIKEVEAVLGHPLESSKITIYMLFYTRPHGIRITGTRFINGIGYPLRIAVGTAGHEMMHPPYDLASDEELQAAIASLKEDSFLMNNFEDRNPTYGYNTFEGLIEEDVVQANDQIINEKFDISIDPRHRWRASDEGMHVFAVVLYDYLKKLGFPEGYTNIRDVLVDAINSGELGPGKIEALYQNFYADS